MPDDARRDRVLETSATLLLALAAIATAWATYQSTVWRGKQAEAQSASIAARVESTRQASVANRQAQVDLALFTQWIDAYAQDETQLTNFYRERFRDEFKPAFEAWLAERPLRNDSAPASPFAMPQYRLSASAEADRLEQKAADSSKAVERNIERANAYQLAVVLFAISLFFAALSTRLSTFRSRATLLGLGYVFFVGTIIWLATQPVIISV